MQLNVPLHLAILRSVKTQARLAAQTGIGEARISRIVNGWCIPSDDERKLIAGAVGAPTTELFQAPRVIANSRGLDE